MEAKGPSVENLMIAANCNTVLNAISYNKVHNIIAYCSANAVLILDPVSYKESIPKVLFSLKGHTDRINAISWLTDSILVSVSADKQIIIWTFEGNPKHFTSWKSKMFSDAHPSTINYLSTYSCSQNEHYILTMCSSGQLKLWRGTSFDDIVHSETLLFSKNLQEAIAMTTIGQSSLLIAVGGYDSNIHIYLSPRLNASQGSDAKLFKYKFSMTGHMNSIRDLSFIQMKEEKGIAYLASASADAYIRLWKIQELEGLQADLEATQDELLQYESKKSYVLKDDSEEKQFNITLESVLISHSEAVQSVRWGSVNSTSVSSSTICLLSSSLDFTVCLWKPDSETGIWSVESTLGAMSGNKHCYFGADFLQDSNSILAYTYNGAMHLWQKSTGEDSENWIPKLTIKGHHGEVNDLDWDPSGDFLLTTSQDQTSRIFSKFGEDQGWFEIGRPQVHGYDMNTIAIVKISSSLNLPNRILSGGDEKVLRLFEAPYSFVKTFNQMHQSTENPLIFSETKSNEEIEQMMGTEAKKQPLGLMNKPVVLANEKARMVDEEGGVSIENFDPMQYLSNTKESTAGVIEDLSEPPLEDILMSRTLWPEVQKLYGHAFEIFAVAVSAKGDCAASSSKAKEKKYADIIIWDIRSGQKTVPCCKLASHTLTVNQLEFSKCDQFLLSCSRDRSWSLFQRKDEVNFQFSLIKRLKDAHTRVVYGINWSHDDLFFATASREKQKSVKIWSGIRKDSPVTEMGALVSELPEENPQAWAVRFFPNLVNSMYSLLVGLESGDINLWQLNSSNEWSLTLKFPTPLAHTTTVRRIKFSTKVSQEGTYTVATCGEDHIRRIFNITF